MSITRTSACIAGDDQSLNQLLLRFIGCCARLDAVAAEEVIWDYAPSGYNNYANISATEGDAATYLTNDAHFVGSKYKKAQYIEYTDATFTTVKPTPVWQGNLGPTIRAEVIQVLWYLLLSA